MKTTEYTGNLNLNLSGQISYKDYRNALLELYLKGVDTLGFLFAMIILLIIFIMGKSTIGLPITGGVLYLILFFSAIYSAKKRYIKNKTFHEKLTYHLDSEKIAITGEMYNFTITWTHFSEIKETRGFFVLYSDSMIANYLDKKMFSAEEIIEFRKFLNSLDVKKKLKNK